MPETTVTHCPLVKASFQPTFRRATRHAPRKFAMKFATAGGYFSNFGATQCSQKVCVLIHQFSPNVGNTS
jgi:hypothetical protein